MRHHKHIHILGICGTFMGGIAAIAKQLGYVVTGSDQHVYPPMSTQLEQLGIELTQGWSEAQFSPEPDLVIVGNALSRGNPAVEYVLNRGIAYTSGAQWLAENCLQDRWVLGVAGTHGKTTTTSMLTWILSDAGMKPGYLIGGVCQHFAQSADLGESPFFVIEADEYDTAFFDKRSKFVHYHPKTLILNNLEFDHADIFPDLAAIERQFHHLIRTVPGIGQVLVNGEDSNLPRVLEQGCWSEQLTFGLGAGLAWRADLVSADGSKFVVSYLDEPQGTVEWDMLGQHNVANGLAAIAAAHHAGIEIPQAIASLGQFQGVKRRLEVRGTVAGVTLYDDFAHHPTAITTTLAGLRSNVGSARMIAVLEPRSNTMKMGVHKDTLLASLQQADEVFIYMPDALKWDWPDHDNRISIEASFDALVSKILDAVQPNDHVVVMSNGGFGGIHQRILDQLEAKSHG